MIVTWKGIKNHLQLKAIARIISEDIQSHLTYPWPPTHQDIVVRDELTDKRLHNVVSWVIYGWGRIRESINKNVNQCI